MLRAIREIQPTYVVGENVLGLVNWNGGLVFNEVQADLEAEGYEVQPFVLPACAVNAPHRRDRVWFVAYRYDSRNATLSSRTNGKQSEESIERQQSQLEHCGFSTTENATNPNSWGLEGSIKVRRNGKYVERKNGTHLQVNNAANPNSNGQHGCNSEHEINTSKGGEYALGNIEQMGEFNDANPNSADSKTQPQGSLLEKQRIEGQTRRFSNASTQSDWLHFPTQPPICAGDDGLSSRLDGITFSKWRNESIKAAGNAIVPQVVYQIFQAISKMP
jgi:DNA (cytosine-5)-methyltransferase 1